MNKVYVGFTLLDDMLPDECKINRKEIDEVDFKTILSKTLCILHFKKLQPHAILKSIKTRFNLDTKIPLEENVDNPELEYGDKFISIQTHSVPYLLLDPDEDEFNKEEIKKIHFRFFVNEIASPE